MSLLAFRPRIGLDVGHRTIKGIELKKQFGRIYLSKCFYHDLSLDNPNFPNNIDIITALKVDIEVNGLVGDRVFTNIGRHLCKYAEISLPKMPLKELAEVLPSQIEKKVKLKVDQIQYDYTVYPDEEKEDFLKIKVYYTKLNKIKMIMKMLEASGVEVGVIDSDELALIRMLKFNDYLEKDKVYVLVDLGETHTTLYLIKNAIVLQSNTLSISFGGINISLQSTFKKDHLTYYDGETYKEKLTLNLDEEDNKQKTVNELGAGILSKVQETIDYYKVYMKKTPFEAIYFVGGGAKCDPIYKEFEDYFGIKVLPVNPLRNISIKENNPNLDIEQIAEYVPLLGMAVGLALRGLISV